MTLYLFNQADRLQKEIRKLEVSIIYGAVLSGKTKAIEGVSTINDKLGATFSVSHS